MKVRIHRGALDVAKLAHEIALNGYVAFSSSRPHQRELARQICEQLNAAGREVREGEVLSSNGPMCIVDTEWHDLDKVREAVVAEDNRWTQDLS